MKFKIFKFKKVTSTNDVAINLIRKKKKEIGCVYADIQTKGRGTHGKKWISNKGNFFGSIFFPLKYKDINIFTVNVRILFDMSDIPIPETVLTDKEFKTLVKSTSYTYIDAIYFS